MRWQLRVDRCVRLCVQGSTGANCPTSKVHSDFPHHTCELYKVHQRIQGRRLNTPVFWRHLSTYFRARYACTVFVCEIVRLLHVMRANKIWLKIVTEVSPISHNFYRARPDVDMMGL